MDRIFDFRGVSPDFVPWKGSGSTTTTSYRSLCKTLLGREVSCKCLGLLELNACKLLVINLLQVHDDPRLQQREELRADDLA